MRFYHGTSEENWQKILKEGVLWGVRFVLNRDGSISTTNQPSRCTYLAVDLEEAKQYGEVILEVDYDVENSTRHNKFDENCWQIRVYEPISLENIKRLV